MQYAVRFRLEQLRPPNGESQGEAVAEAIRQGLVQFVRDNRIGPVENYSLAMPIHHSTGTHTWTSCQPLPLTYWLNGSQITEAWLDRLAKQLNSAESFDATNGEFYVELLFLKNRQRGSGLKKNNDGSMSYEQLLKKKRCTINIKNRDELCFARAFVSTKAYVDQDPQYKNMSKGRGLQGYLAHKLHQETGVTEGACGSEQIQQIQDHVGPEGYQIKVFEGQQGKLWLKDDKFNDPPKKICLLKVENHFHGLRSVPALLNRSYYCHYCEKGYNVNDSEHHNCRGQNCSACKRTNKTCPNFATFETPEVYCSVCNRFFYGQNCYDAHKQHKICGKFVKCFECCNEYKYNKKKKHVCGEYFCRNCKETVRGEHPCFIQPIEEEKEKNKSGLRTVAENEDEEMMLEFEEEENEAESSGKESKKAEPIVCAIDFESSVDEAKNFKDVRVGWRYIGVEGSYREAGTAVEMLTDVMSKTVTRWKGTLGVCVCTQYAWV